MKSILTFAVTGLMIFQCHSLVSAQGRQGGNQQRGGQGQRGQGGQVPPLFRIFDADGNNELSEQEIENATKVIRKLDANQDGKVTPEEFRPSGGQGGGAGRQGGPGGQQGGGAGRQGGGAGGQQGRGMQGDSGGRAGQGGRSGQGGPPRGQQGGAGGPGGRPGGQGGGRGGDPAQADAQFAKQIMELDANQNNMIGSDEIPEHMQVAFKLADADKNGSLNNTEILVLASQFRRNKLNPDGENTEMKNRPTGGAPQSRR